MSSTSCLATPTASSSTRYTLSAATQLARPTPTSFVYRNARNATLGLDGREFRVVGPNIYWLGLDENVDPSPSYPSKSRVLEAMAIASAMGATTVRSTSLGVSVGTGLSIENALNTFKPDGSAAWDAIDFAVYAARAYGLRLILPLTDQYDYYHGGIPTFLRWRNLSSTDFSPFYDLDSDVYSDFTRYIETLLTHVSPYTNLTLATDPTILAFETGNELGSWTGDAYPPPVEWTTSISQLLKRLAPDTLVVSGSYGVRKDELAIASVDVHSDHFYPTYKSRLSSSASTAQSGNKPFLVGEYDWTNQYYLRYRWTYFALLVPAVFAVGVWAFPKRWWPWRGTVRGIATCGCCRGRKRRRRDRHGPEGGGAGTYDRMPLEARRHDTDSAVMERPAFIAQGSSSNVELTSRSRDGADLSKPTTPFDVGSSAASTSSFPILTAQVDQLPSLPNRQPPRRESFASKILDSPIVIPRWLLSLSLLLLALPLFGIIYTYLPTPISTFTASLESLETTTTTSNGPRAVGDLYWSLFGKDDTCCAYVEHADGCTLHYPSDPSSSSSSRSSTARGSGDAVAALTRHAWKVRGEEPFWWIDDGTGFDLDKIQFDRLPVVACPQAGLALANGTVVGGS
ncbi:hypothetical protein JCM10212_003947 [Sporobolomyces blumeae]